MSTRRRTVALVFPGCHRRGGVERVVREHARRLRDRFDVTFVGYELDDEGMEGVSFAPVPRPEPGPVGRLVPDALAFRRGARAVLRERADDLVVSFGVDCPPGDILVVGSVHRAWLRSSAPIPTRVGAIPPAARYAMPQHLALLALERSYFRSTRPTWIAACSDRTGAEVVDRYGVDPSIVVTMPNGFDHDEFGPSVRAEHRSSMRARIAGGAAQIVVLFVANELHRKGFVTLLDAVAQVDDPRLHVHVVGRVEPGSYRTRIDDLGLSARVHWHGPQDEVAPWYAAADLFVLPTQYEPFGNVIVEALAMGVPVITTSIAGAAAAVAEGTNGFLQRRPTDPGELAGLLRRASAPAELAALQAQAADGVSRFDWDVLSGQLAGLLDTVTNRE